MGSGVDHGAAVVNPERPGRDAGRREGGAHDVWCRMNRAVLVVALAVMLPAVPAAGQDLLRVVGTWTAPCVDGRADGETLIFQEQRGRLLQGLAVYRKGGGSRSETLVGRLMRDGRAVYLAGDGGIHLGRFVSETTLDLCYVEPPPSAAAPRCRRFTRPPDVASP